jgi:hypothetical protein
MPIREFFHLIHVVDDLHEVDACCFQAVYAFTDRPIPGDPRA